MEMTYENKIKRIHEIFKETQDKELTEQILTREHIWITNVKIRGNKKDWFKPINIDTWEEVNINFWEIISKL